MYEAEVESETACYGDGVRFIFTGKHRLSPPATSDDTRLESISFEPGGHLIVSPRVVQEFLSCTDKTGAKDYEKVRRPRPAPSPFPLLFRNGFSTEYAASSCRGNNVAADERAYADDHRVWPTDY
ncbi:MAG: hypothetical protein LC731_04350, partial [Acidobacteria bacterium]|nr:hypothetical protein [Acidobacteriota bacterium]